MGDRRRTRGGQRLTSVPSDAPPSAKGDTVEAARAKLLGEQLLSFAAQGVPVGKAAEHLGIPETSARRYYQAALDAVPGLSDEEKREQIRLDLEALRLLVAAHMPYATGTATRKTSGKGGKAGERVTPSIGSAQVVLAAMRERANRLGLDAALQVNISNQAIGDAVSDIQAIILEAAPVELPELPALPPMPSAEDAG